MTRFSRFFAFPAKRKVLGCAKIVSSKQKFWIFRFAPLAKTASLTRVFCVRVAGKRAESHLDGLIAAVSYEDPTVKKLVHNFKYRFIGDISLLFAKLICSSLIRNDFPLPDFIVPVPLHPKRLRWRGFNQSLLLAEHISKDLAPLMEIEVLDILERQKYNQPQMQVKNYKERLKNVQNIFALKPDANPDLIKNKNILLIDDIATTGATLEECAKVLKDAGAKKVFAAVVARQVLKK